MPPWRRSPTKSRSASLSTSSPEMVLRSDNGRIELERAILQGTVDLLGKDRSVDPRMLTNREKTILVESLRPIHELSVLLDGGCLRAAAFIKREHPCVSTDISNCVSA